MTTGTLNKGASRVFRLKASFEFLGISPATGFRWIASGVLPKPLLLGPRARGYQFHTLEQILTSKQQG